ncbi:MAG: acyl carrier protein [Butyricicoccus sp.]|nr:acyl carrier protein [Butyricicoccus sp.]
MVFEKLCTLLAEQLGVEADTITPETSLADDLNADSLDLVELMMSIEEEFDVGEIDEETAAGIQTVGDILRLIGEE